MNSTSISFRYSETRRFGNTEYILRALINDPKCTIIFSNKKLAEKAKERYSNLLKEKEENRIKNLSFFGKIINRIFPKKKKKNQVETPKFVSIDDSLAGSNTPVLFDLSCFN